jgi:hypothetical protein
MAIDASADDVRHWANTAAGATVVVVGQGIGALTVAEHLTHIASFTITITIPGRRIAITIARRRIAITIARRRVTVSVPARRVAVSIARGVVTGDAQVCVAYQPLETGVRVALAAWVARRARAGPVVVIVAAGGAEQSRAQNDPCEKTSQIHLSSRISQPWPRHQSEAI